VPERVQQDTPNQEHASGCFVRLAWMLVANVILVISALSIVRNGGVSFSLADVVFWAAAAGAIWLRHVDVSRLGGETVYGRPATMADWRRYAVLLLAVAVVVWVVAHAAGWAAGR
jgi:hypothetical protein